MAARRYRDQAALAAALRYEPQTAALMELLTQRRGQFDAAVGASQAAATGIARSAKQAIRPTRQDFAASAQASDARQAAAVQGLSALGDAADPYKAALTTESALADQMARERQRATVDELRSRAVDARAGAGQEQRQLRAEYAGDVGDIGRQLQTAVASQGAYSSQVFADLLEKAAGRRVQLRGQDISAETQRRGQNISSETQRRGQDISRETQRQRAAADARRARGGRRSYLTPFQANEDYDKIDAARFLIRRFEAEGATSGEIRALLSEGHETPRMRVYDEFGRPEFNRDGTQKTVGGSRVPQFDRQIINAAYDLYEFGHLSAANIKALRNRGLRPLERYGVAPLPGNEQGPPVPGTLG